MWRTRHRLKNCLSLLSIPLVLWAVNADAGTRPGRRPRAASDPDPADAAGHQRSGPAWYGDDNLVDHDDDGHAPHQV